MKTLFSPQRRSLLGGAAALLATGSVWPQSQFPDRPLTIVVPYPAGASTDLLARTLAPKLTLSMGQPVIVDNRGGASGNIGAVYVANGPADGYRILLATEPIIVINPHLYPNMGTDPTKDLVPLANAATTILALAVHPSIPVSTMPEFIAYVKARPKQLFFGTAGTGTPHHINGIILNQRTGMDLVHVPYKGSGPMTTDLLAGQIKIGISTLSTLLPLAREGKLKIIGIGEKARVASAPDIPTIGETVPGFVMSGWVGFFAPAATPPAVVARWNTEFMKALHSPEITKKLDEAGLPVLPPNKPEELAARIKEDFPVYGKVIREAGIKVE